MGVSGCGKSQIGAAFAAEIGANFFDGDDLHPSANIAKMCRGEPLNDADRAPWLAMVGQKLTLSGSVIACSALKRIYRDQIRAAADAPVCFLYLHGAHEILLSRMTSRPGHFMPTALLDSQLATLEPPDDDEWHLRAQIDFSPAEIVAIFADQMAHAHIKNSS
jgi:gluconokinase